jgi:predicted transcriptional regulator
MNVFPKTQTTYIGVRLTPDLKAHIDIEARRTQTTTTEIIRRALKSYLKVPTKRKP